MLKCLQKYQDRNLEVCTISFGPGRKIQSITSDIKEKNISHFQFTTTTKLKCQQFLHIAFPLSSGISNFYKPRKE